MSEGIYDDNPCREEKYTQRHGFQGRNRKKRSVEGRGESLSPEEQDWGQ
jgi:hypothetical protein